MKRATGRFIGVGTGPGDPELLTLKAVRALGEADVLAYFAKRGNAGNARTIVAAHAAGPSMIELPLLYPVTTEIDKDHDDYKRPIAGFYEQSARAVAEHLDAGRTVAVLSEGDPLFYGSYMHLHVRLAHRFPTEVIPGVTAMSGCWSLAGLPIVQGDDVLSVLPGTMAEERAGAPARRHRRRRDHEGRPQPAEDPPRARGRRQARRRPSMSSAARWPTAQSMRLADKPDDDAPYFSLVLVPGWERAAMTGRLFVIGTRARQRRADDAGGRAGRRRRARVLRLRALSRPARPAAGPDPPSPPTIARSWPALRRR